MALCLPLIPISFSPCRLILLRYPHSIPPSLPPTKSSA
ncbi:Uncharacterised protein [Vibrio cholerae]|nr:Uncharacterised protein [Vibrio cholerae]